MVRADRRTTCRRDRNSRSESRLVDPAIYRGEDIRGAVNSRLPQVTGEELRRRRRRVPPTPRLVDRYLVEIAPGR